LKLKCDEPLSDFAFNFDLRRYSVADPAAVLMPEVHGVKYGADGRTLVALPYDKAEHAPAECRAKGVEEFYHQERKRCIVEEDERSAQGGGRGLHSSTFQLNLSRL
jgi:hypothetical protein